jgi:hypothetical protein
MHRHQYPLSLVWGGLDQLHTPQIEKRMDNRSGRLQVLQV